jgi:hypothetical protein
MSGTPVSRIVHYRGRSDTGAVDDAPTFIAAEDTSFSVTPGTNFRIRIGVENTGTGSDTITAPDTTRGIVRCGYSAVAYATLANVINGADAGSSADAANVTTQRLTSGTGSFATGTNGYDENETLSCAVANGAFTEVEFGVVLTGGASTIGVGGGETWTFQVGGLTNASANVPTFTTADTNGSDFQHGNQLGGAGQEVANAATISFTTAAAARSGNLVVVHVACNNAGSADGDNSDISGVTFGGTAMAKAIEFSNSQGGASAGATSSIWWLQISGSDVAAGATVEATFTTATTSGDANAIQGREFVIASGKTVSVEATGTLATDGTNQPGSLDVTTSNIECLRVCANSFEVGNTAISNLVRASNSSWSLWWTDGALARASGSNTTAGMSSIVEAKISTGTGAASQIGVLTSGGTSDWATAYVAFKAEAGTDFEDGAGAADGQSTAAATSQATKDSPGAATGQSTAAATSQATKDSPGAATGDAQVAGVGASTYAAAGAAAGDAQVAGAGASSYNAAGAAAGDAQVSAASAATKDSPGVAAGDAQVAGVGASIFSAAGAAAGDAQVSGISPAENYQDGAGAADGQSTAAATSNATKDSPGVAAGDATAAATGASTYDAAAVAAGDAQVSGVGASTYAAAGTAAGDAQVSAASAATKDSAGAAAGDAQVSGIGASIFSAVGAAAGDATASAAVGSFEDAVGAALGESTATGAGAYILDAIGEAAGDATAAGILAAFYDAPGAAAGTATASAIIIPGYSAKLSSTILVRPLSGTVTDRRASGTTTIRPRTDTAIAGRAAATEFTKRRTTTIIG